MRDMRYFFDWSPDLCYSDLILSTVLFTDIVASTEHAARLGDRAWRDLLDSHHALVRKELARWRGREIKTVGDAFIVTFDGRPALFVVLAVFGTLFRSSELKFALVCIPEKSSWLETILAGSLSISP